MSNDHTQAASADEAPTNRPKADYAVGYGKPPAAHRFKNGNKANTKGRRKGSRNRKLAIQEILLEPVAVREGGEIKQVPAIVVLIKKLLSKAFAGDNRAAITIIGLAQKEGLLTPEQDQVVDNLSESDLAIMEDVKRRLDESTLEQPKQVSAKTSAA